MQKPVVRCVGVDIFLEAPLTVKLPDTVGNLKLKHVASRGMTVTSANAAQMLDVGWVCARYLFAGENAGAMEGREDEGVAQLVSRLGTDYRWSSLVKLFDHGGHQAFT